MIKIRVKKLGLERDNEAVATTLGVETLALDLK